MFQCCSTLFRKKDLEKSPLLIQEEGINKEQITLLLTDYKKALTELHDFTTKSLINQVLTALPGIATNAGAYAALTILAPQFAYAGLVGSMGGAIIHSIMHKVTGVDGTKGFGPSAKSMIEHILNGAPISDGVRGLGTLVAKANPTAGLAVATILPALAQAALINGLSKNREAVQLQTKVAKLANELGKIKADIGEEFDTIISEQLKSEETESLFAMIKKAQ